MYPNSLSVTERLSLSNQFRILATLNDEDDHYLVKAEILENGYSGLYNDVFHSIDDETAPGLTKEVHDILTMYRNINIAIKRLEPEDAAGLDLDKIRFKGFDGNHDPHYHLMVFMIDRMNLYKELVGTELNSHGSSSMYNYRSMVALYLDLRDNHHNQDYSKEDLQRFIELV